MLLLLLLLLLVVVLLLQQGLVLLLLLRLLLLLLSHRCAHWRQAGRGGGDGRRRSLHDRFELLEINLPVTVQILLRHHLCNLRRHTSGGPTTHVSLKGIAGRDRTIEQTNALRAAQLDTAQRTGWRHCTWASVTAPCRFRTVFSSAFEMYPLLSLSNAWGRRGPTALSGWPQRHNHLC